MHHLANLSGLLTLLAALISNAAAVDPASRQMEFFENEVRPLLVKHCLECHGAQKQQGGLRLDSRAAILKGGESGEPAVIPGHPHNSLLLAAVRRESLAMPPDGPLTESEIRILTQWIEDGAPWSENTAQIRRTDADHISDEDRDWWAFQPLAAVAVPDHDDDRWSHHAIDRFVFARLAQDDIRPAAAADHLTLRRRAAYALTGLPPAVDNPDETFDATIDRLLASSAYGVNQARFWLDLVRYADTDGYRADHLRPEAKHYRDYVIRSFNDDKPYDRFVMEQLAGDELDPGNRDAVIATMYLRHWIYEHNQRDVEGQWQEILCDITNTTADVFLAQGFKCCRCHDHKFDPLLQKDYYCLQSFFAAVQPIEDQPIAAAQERATWLQQQRAWETATDDLRRRLHEIENPVLLQHASREGAAKFVDQIKDMIGKRAEDRTPYEHQIASLASRQFDVHPDKLSEWLDAATEAKRQQLRTQLAEFDGMKPKPLPTQKFVVADVGPVAPVTLIPDVAQQTPIAPGFPTVLDPAPADIVPPDSALQSTGRRTALAKWIASPQNPLTARVIVNRIWQQHFGRGLVATASDFGHLGEPPSHPQLLDWLANRFVEDDWSLKMLHRLILTSATWQQSSLRRADHRLQVLDPEPNGSGFEPFCEPRKSLLRNRNRQWPAGNGPRSRTAFLVEGVQSAFDGAFLFVEHDHAVTIHAMCDSSDRQLIAKAIMMVS